jgi:NADH-quinone oxidoreductase subunit L
VLAYSTISQLGFMFVAAGMRAYGVAMFFLVAHAFYKALLFLGAGSVIHGMHDEQDLRQMGGLRSLMPITFATFAIGALAQAGIPPLTGFFAKDAVLEVAQHTGREVAYVLGSIAAFFSAFYLGRMLFLTFFGEGRSDRARQAHESPPVLWVPLAILAVGVATAGWLNLTPEGRLTGFLEQITGAAPVGNGLEVAALAATATVISIVALALTWWIYGSGRVDWIGFRERLEPLPRAALNGWYVDRAYDTAVIQPAKTGAWITAYVIDGRIIDGAVNAVGGGVEVLAEGGRRVQTGFVRSYALAVFLGAVAILVYVGVRS